jgi:hypothetical protein
MKRVFKYFIFLFVLCCLTASAGADSGPAVGPPSQLRLFITENGFQLTWKPSPQDPGRVTGYEIVRSGEFTGPYERLAVVKEGVHQYLDTSAAPDVVYFFKVRAMAGDEYSHFSNIAGGERPSSLP